MLIFGTDVYTEYFILSDLLMTYQTESLYILKHNKDSATCKEKINKMQDRIVTMLIYYYYGGVKKITHPENF